MKVYLPMHNSSMIKEMLVRTLQNGGFTLDCSNSDSYYFTEDLKDGPTKELYCVSNWDGDFYKCPIKKLSLQRISKILHDLEWSKKRSPHNDGRGFYHAIGAWTFYDSSMSDGEEWVAFDPVLYVMDKEEALQRAAKLNQKAIWDMRNDCEIEVIQ